VGDTARWQAYPPYGGRFDEVVAHLTIGEGAAYEELVAAEQAVQPTLPIEAQAKAVSLLVKRGNVPAWTVHAEFPLRGSLRP
jgi:hypothetical protein